MNLKYSYFYIVFVFDRQLQQLIGTYATYLFVSPLNPYSTIVTLLFVLLITSIKEGIEDLARARSDKFENLKDVTVITFSSEGEIIETVKKSKDINPGDIVKLTGQVAVPVDLLLIMTSLYYDGNKCYIETANIDGETNLKVREAPPLLIDSFGQYINNGKVIREIFEGTVEIEAPNRHIHTFVGTLKLNGANETIPLGPTNVLLRSSLFSNTEWGYGIALYTGQETKIQMNNRKAPSKMSRLEEQLNQAIIIIFCAQFVLVTMSVISIYILGFQSKSNFGYLYPDGNSNASILPLWLEEW